MKFQTTIVLLVLLLALGFWFAFVEWERETSDERADRDREQKPGAGQLLFDDGASFDADVVGFTIETPDGSAVFAKDGEDWWQTAPVRFKLNSWSAGNIPTDMGALRTVRQFTPGSDGSPTLEKTKLAPAPLAVVTLETDQNGTKGKHIVKLGRKSIGGIAYAMVAGDDDVHVVNDDLHDRLVDKQWSAWRDKSISGPKEGQVDQVVIERGATTVTLAKADGAWALGSPHGGRVDRSAVETLLNAIDGFYVKDFIKDQPSDLSAYGLDRPAAVVRMRKPAAPTADATGSDDAPADDAASEAPAEPTIYTLTIGGPADLTNEAFFATWSVGVEGGDVVFTLGKSSAEDLEKNVDDFRDARITPLQATDVRQVKIERGAADPTIVHLLQTEGQWAFDTAADPGFAADAGAVQDLIDDVVGAKATGYVPDAAPAGPPIATVTLGALARAEPDLLRLYAAEDDGKVMVMRNNETTGYLVAAEDVNVVEAPIRTWRDRGVLQRDQDLIHALTVTRPDGTSFAFTRELPAAAESTSSDGEAATSQPATPKPGPWTMAGDAAFDQAALDTLVRTVSDLRAEDWPADAAAPGEGATIIEVTARDQSPARIALDVDARIASVDGGMPFALAEDTVEKLDAELRNRTALAITTLDIEQIAVARGETLLTLTRNADDDYVDAGGAAIDQSAAGGLFDTLAGLRVQRYVTAEPPASPAISIDITTKEGTHTLLVGDAADAQRTVHIDGRAARLSEDVFGTLTAAWVASDEDDDG